MGRRLGNIITLVGRSELSLFNLSSVLFCFGSKIAGADG